MKIEYLSKSEEESFLFAKKFSKELKGGDVICFYADLGAGKTLVTKGLCEGLGFSGYVNSPSYIILNEYSTKEIDIYHYDLYRLGSADELFEISFYEYCGKNNSITIIEWAEIIKDVLPKKRYDITIEIIDHNKRKIKIEKIEG